MSLDKRYGCGVSSLSLLIHMWAGEMIRPLPQAAQCILPQPGYSGPLSFAACSWWLTASLPTGPQRKNRWRAVALEDPLRERPGAEPVRRTPLLLNNSSQSLAPVPLSPLLNLWCAVAQRPILHSGAIRNPGIILALIKSRGRKNGGGV